MKPIFFEDQLEFRKWLEIHHSQEKEIIVGYYKIGADKPSMTWSQSVDQALCFGWIDGIRRSIDEISYCIRFTPRNPKSVWSDVNIKKVEVLTGQGLMNPAGLDIFNKRKDDKSKIYSYENKPVTLSEEYENIFKANGMAWEFFSTQVQSYQKSVFYWIMSAKLESTRITRLEKLIDASSQLMKVR